MTLWTGRRRTLATTILVAAGAIASAVHPGTALAGPALLVDASSGRVIYSEDADDLWHPASVTKVMTAYLVFEAIKAGKISLDSKIVQSELSHAEPPSKVGLPVGGELTVEVGLKALIVKSANDVAIMLAEAVGGSKDAFVEHMNATAKRLGMTRTKFVNPHGLPAPDQVTTARDLAKLARAVLRDFPEHAALWAMPDMRIGRIKLRTHNRLLKTYEGADGLKTGFTCDSGYNVVATATRDGRKLVAVVLGEPSGLARNTRTANLLEHGFQYAAWMETLAAPTFDRMAMPANAAGQPVSVRETVAGFECGRPRPRVARTKRPMPKSAQIKAAAAAKQKQRQAAVQQGGEATPSAAGKTAPQAASAAQQAAPAAAAPKAPVAAKAPAAPVAKVAQ
ncbi:MAG TPA: D-alanyl-D-alanine carboxypeptidase family protein [Hyphomicrobiaceae bacterium]|nr:D-alanyl-D-alanine carboxypeptidase family protein [Hyphomicrobiaceae bacterium]